jgi:hypothetical protein
LALRDAAVRLTLQSGAFLGGLSDVSNKVQALGRELSDKLKSSVQTGITGAEGAFKSGLARMKGGLGTFFSGLKAPGIAGLGAMKTQLGGLANEAHQAVQWGTAIGGAISLGEAAREALTLTEQYRNIAHAVEDGTGKAMKWQQVQSQVEATATRWRQRNTEVAQSFTQIFEEVGNADFARAGMESAARAATATGKSMGTLSAIVGTLNEKFGIGAEDIDESLATVIAMGNKGGASVEDLSQRLGVLGASAELMGLGGKKGLQTVVAMLNVADNVTGTFKKSLASVTGVLDTFSAPEKLQKIQKDLHIKITNKDGTVRSDALDRILAKTGGKKELLAKVFSGESLKLVTEFGKIYSKAFDETQGKVKAKTESALAAFHSALDEAGKQTLTAAQLDAQAREMLTVPSKNLNDALNKLTDSFSSPAALGALDKLSQRAPRAAESMAKLVEFTANHPLLAVAGYAGGRMALSGAGSFTAKLGERGLKAAGAGLGKMFMAEIGKGGPWALAGKSVGIAAAALIAYELGKSAINNAMNEADQRNTAAVEGGNEAFLAARSGDKNRQRAALESEKLRLGELEKGPSLIETTFSGLAKLTGSDVKGAGQRQGEQIGETKKHIKELEDALRKGSEGGNDAARALRQVAAAANEATRALRKTPGSNGLPNEPGNSPGYEDG